MLVLQDELPFTQPIAEYPVHRQPAHVPSFAEQKEVCPSIYGLS